MDYQVLVGRTARRRDVEAAAGEGWVGRPALARLQYTGQQGRVSYRGLHTHLTVRSASTPALLLSMQV